MTIMSLLTFKLKIHSSVFTSFIIFMNLTVINYNLIKKIILNPSRTLKTKQNAVFNKHISNKNTGGTCY